MAAAPYIAVHLRVENWMITLRISHCCLAVADSLLNDSSILSGWKKGFLPFEKKTLSSSHTISAALPQRAESLIQVSRQLVMVLMPSHVEVRRIQFSAALPQRDAEIRSREYRDTVE
ncbi:hypothetical protein F3Y22_tig00116962pilonHSYRG00732 [Hibiscus syriacus]|uniref:O-fucosyltransferase family protein n=1 Tax=Hibiscus syriacus TaxID=106335 RepID=A0A6A2XYB8_HIBSY|nr:hypothetical protein F3Y22_tig00116962pilonHSYRG00732 [Hibiscus syriacus]